MRLFTDSWARVSRETQQYESPLSYNKNLDVFQFSNTERTGKFFVSNYLVRLLTGPWARVSYLMRTLIARVSFRVKLPGAFAYWPMGAYLMRTLSAPVNFCVKLSGAFD